MSFDAEQREYHEYSDYDQSRDQSYRQYNSNDQRYDQGDDQAGEQSIDQYEMPVESYEKANHDSADIPREQPRLQSGRRLRRDVVETILLVVVIYTLVNLTTARAIIEGPSMQPNFYTGQLMIVNRLAYFFASPKRGDVVVLHNPYQQCQAPEKIETTGCEDLIKRVIGLPNEKIVIENGRVTVDGKLLDEPYVKDYCHNICDGHWETGPNQYFVLGDNRNNSSDSHSFGPIARTLIVGEAWVRYWPLPDVRVIPHPSYDIPVLNQP